MFSPIGMTQEQLVHLLQDITQAIEHGDSFEGNLEYLMPDEKDYEANPGVQFMVRGAYRVGNSMGQGGMRFIGAREGATS